MIELIKGDPLIIDGDPLSKANLSMDYRLKNVPVHKINNGMLAGKKRRFEMCNCYKDLIVWTLRKYFGAGTKYPLLPLDQPVYIAMELCFLYKKKGGKAQHLRKDMDNCEKLIYDALEAAGVYENDSQIVLKIVQKTISSDTPCLKIRSISSGLDPFEWTVYVHNKTRWK